MTEDKGIRWGRLMLGLGASVLVITIYFWVVFLVIGLGLDAPDWVAIPLALLLLATTVVVVVAGYRRGNQSLAIGVALGYALLTVISLGQCTLLVALVPT